MQRSSSTPRIRIVVSCRHRIVAWAPRCPDRRGSASQPRVPSWREGAIGVAHAARGELRGNRGPTSIQRHDFAFDCLQSIALLPEACQLVCKPCSCHGVRYRFVATIVLDQRQLAYANRIKPHEATHIPAPAPKLASELKISRPRREGWSSRRSPAVALRVAAANGLLTRVAALVPHVQLTGRSRVREPALRCALRSAYRLQLWHAEPDPHFPAIPEPARLSIVRDRQTSIARPG